MEIIIVVVGSILALSVSVLCLTVSYSIIVPNRNKDKKIKNEKTFVVSDTETAKLDVMEEILEQGRLKPYDKGEDDGTKES